MRNGRILITPQDGPYPPADGGVGVLRLFHKLRSANPETFNDLFKGLFDAHRSVPGALFFYQLMLLARFEAGLPLPPASSLFPRPSVLRPGLG